MQQGTCIELTQGQCHEMRRRHRGTLQEQIQAGEQSVSRTSDCLDFRLITV